MTLWAEFAEPFLYNYSVLLLSTFEVLKRPNLLRGVLYANFSNPAAAWSNKSMEGTASEVNMCRFEKLMT